MINSLFNRDAARQVIIACRAEIPREFHNRLTPTASDQIIGHIGRVVWCTRRIAGQPGGTLLEGAWRQLLRYPNAMTAASFWIGNPADPRKRELLGVTHMNGFPRAVSKLTSVWSADEFKVWFAGQFETQHYIPGWTFPWVMDLFATECTYALINNAVHVAWFRGPFRHLGEELLTDPRAGELPELPQHTNVPILPTEIL